jgi:hypothetical protein
MSKSSLGKRKLEDNNDIFIKNKKRKLSDNKMEEEEEKIKLKKEVENLKREMDIERKAFVYGSLKRKRDKKKMDESENLKKMVVLHKKTFTIPRKKMIALHKNTLTNTKEND